MLKKGHAFLTSLLLLICITFPFLVLAQNTQPATLINVNPDADYESYPQYQLNFTHLDWELSFDPETATGQGIARYQVEAYPFSGDTLVIQTLKTEIQDVRLNDASIDYLFKGDSLLIPFSEDLSEISELSLVYTFGNETGLYRNGTDIIFTSMLPGEVAHYLPGVIHPRTRLTAEVNVTVPAGFDVVLPGKVGDSTEGEDEVTHNFTWESPHSITDMNFAVGKFESQDTYLGVKKVHLYYTKNQFSEEEIAELLRNIYSTVKKSERLAEREYPFESLQIVVLQDAMWETKQSSAGFGFLFLNRPVKEQIALIVAQQWLGSYVQPETWAAAHQLTYPISLLYSRLIDDKVLSELAQSEPEADHLLYKWAHLYHVHEMAQKLNLAENEQWRTIFEQSIADLISQGGEVITKQRIQDSYYQQAGRLVPALDLPKKVTSAKDTITISIVASFDEEKQNLTLISAIGDSLNNLGKVVKVALKGQEESYEIGISDSISIPNAGFIDNIYPQWVGSDDYEVNFSINKPFRFWVDDLRNGTMKDKIYAADAVAKDTTASDRELLVSEQLKKTEQAEVKAVLLLALSDISGGALGTQERYLKAINSDDEIVKEAAIKSFRKFDGNEQMIYELKRIINSDSFPSLTKPALYSLSIIDEKTAFNTFIQRKLRNNNNKNVFYFAVPAIYAQMGDTASSISYATQLDDDSYDYPVREKMVQRLINLIDSEEQLRELAKGWVNDSDPRLRFFAFRELEKHNKELFVELAKERVMEEQDVRVLRLIASTNL